MNPRWTGLAKFSSVYLRFALGISFLSAVADRFGFWGAYGQPNVAWGNYARFVEYTAKLNWFLPAAMPPALSIIVTAAETLFGLLLIVGWKTRITALLSGVLLTCFALTMTVTLGVKSPLNFSVFSAAGEPCSWECVQISRLAWTNWFAGIGIQPTFSVVLGIRSARQGIPVSLALPAFLQSYIANLVTAGVRLIPLGQTQGQAALLELEEPVLAVSAQAERATIEDLGSAAFLVDLASMAHETQYTRLFRS